MHTHQDYEHADGRPEDEFRSFDGDSTAATSATEPGAAHLGVTMSAAAPIDDGMSYVGVPGGASEATGQGAEGEAPAGDG